MSCNSYVLAMTSICDREEGFKRLSNALIKIDETLKSNTNTKKQIKLSIPQKIHSVTNAKKLTGTVANLEISVGKISLEYVFAYPPGIPILVPGEVIDKQTISVIDNLKNAKVNIIFSKSANTNEIFISNNS